MATNKKSLIDEYFDYQLNFEEKYGPNTIVLMEVGSFYEIYGVDNENEKIGKVQEISNLLNIQMTRKNKNIIETSRKNPLLCGIPTVSIDRYLDIILKENRYTVVMIEQVTQPPNPKREVTKIISPGTMIDVTKSADSNNLLSIYIEKIKEDTYVAGMSVVDVSTGKNGVHESFSIKGDEKFPIDEVYRFIKSHSPKEVILTAINCDDINQLVNYLELDKIVTHIHDSIDKNLTKLTYQNQFLGEIFKPKSMISPIEFINLEFKIYGLISYMILLKFVYEHNPTLINKIEKPQIYENNKYLKLNNNALYQLNVLPNVEALTSGSRFNSLLSVIDNCSTSMGKRLLKFRLTNPVKDRSEIERRYRLIENIGNITDDIEPFLNQIIDIERLHRKLELGVLNPSEFYNLHVSYSNILEIFNIIEESDIGDFKVDNVLKENINNFVNEYNRYFDLEEMSRYNLNDIKNSFIKPHINSEIDNIQYSIDALENKVKKIGDKLNKSLPKDFKMKLEYNDRDKLHFITTKNRIDMFKKNFKPFTYDEATFDLDNIEIKSMTTSAKIKHRYLEKLSDDITLAREKIKTLVRDEYLNILDDLYYEYCDMFKDIVNYISELDISKSGWRVAKKYRYTKPEVKDGDAFIEAIGLRHPIIERLNSNTIYVPNNITLGKDGLDGMLVYGTNASGKSSLMKSIGLNIILAQSGFYVPAKSFKFSPFSNIFTRISGDDNIFKGLSSFAVEMSELRDILRRADNNSLVLGDEISHGTETISGLAIVASAVITLSDKKSKFMFATHLHKLSSMDRINELDNVEHYHLKVIYDEKSGNLIYDRKLEKGPGDAIYGLEVAKAMNLDRNFLKLANDIRKEIIENEPIHNIINNKTSTYNSDVIKSKCMICGKRVEEVHHINEQKLSDENGYIEHFHKNHKANLVPLCKEHHKMVHDGKIKINGFKESSDGIILDFEIID